MKRLSTVAHLVLTALGLCCCAGFSLGAESGVSSLVAAHELLTAVAPLAVDRGSGCAGLGSCGGGAQYLQFPGSRAQAQWLWLTGLVALLHVGSSQTRGRTRVSCIGRWILCH